LLLGCAHGMLKIRNVLTFSSRSGAVSVCATQARGICSVTCFTTIHCRNLDVAWRIYNNRLTWARRMVACAFDTLCNKWRSFYFAIDVYPDFWDVIVRTCCIVHNFVRQRDGFQFQATSYECPLESVKAVGTRGNVTGTTMGKRAQGERHHSPSGSRWGA
jgi:hypothetical protein